MAELVALFCQGVTISLIEKNKFSRFVKGLKDKGHGANCHALVVERNPQSAGKAEQPAVVPMIGDGGAAADFCHRTTPSDVEQ